MTKAKKWKYEFIFILPPNLEKKDQASLLKRVEGEIAKAKGVVDKQNDWGLKTLAYLIKNQAEGQYFVWEVSFAENPLLREVDLFLNREDQMLRYLWIKL